MFLDKLHLNRQTGLPVKIKTGKYGLPTCTTTEKITTRLQNKYHSESSEKQTVWKSDKQGIKEVTFIQMGMRHGDIATCGEAQRHRDIEQAVPHLCGG